MGFSKRNIDPKKRNSITNGKVIVKYITKGGVDGKNGKNGTNGLNATLTVPSSIFKSTNGTALDNQTSTTYVQAYNGTVKMDASIGAVSGAVTGITTTLVNNGEKNAGVQVNVSNSLVTQKGTLTIPIVFNTYDPRDASGNKDASYWDGSVYPLTSIDLKYNWELLDIPTSDTSIYYLDLSNQVAAINCDASGKVLPGAMMPTCVAELTLNYESVADASYGLVLKDNLRGVSIDNSLGKGILKFEASTLAWDTTSTVIQVDGYRNNEVKDSAFMTLIKSLPGGQGQDAVSYWLSISASKIKVNPNNYDEIIPSSISVTGNKQVGGNAATSADDCSIFWGYETTTPSTPYTGTITNINKNKEYIYFTLKKNNVIRDRELVPILWEGRNGNDGSKGADGSSAYVLDLTNENMSINCDASGNILPGAYIPSSTAKLYYGGNYISSGVTYSITGTSSTIPTGTITINSSTGQITILNSLSFNATELAVTIQASHSGKIFTKVMNISKAIAGAKGNDGSAGITPTIGVNGNWWIGTTDTGVKAEGVDGNTPYIQNGYWYINGVSTGVKAEGVDGSTPYIQNGYWYINGVSTGVKAEGEDGETPTIGDNGHWWIGGVDTGVMARGQNGVSITNVYEWYAATVNTTAPALASYIRTVPSDYGENKPYLWNYEQVLYSNDTSTSTTPKIIGRYGKDGSTGSAGKGIRAITEYYNINDSSTTAPSTWQTSFIAPTILKPYLWNKENIIYTDDSSTWTNPAIIGIRGNDGSKGADAISYWLEMTANEVYVDVNNNNTCDPSIVYVKAWRQVGENNPEELSVSSFVKYDPDASYGSTICNGTINPTLFVPEHKFITVTLYVNNIVRDNETIQLLRSGKDGSKGDKGDQGIKGAVVRGPIQWEDSSTANARRFSNGEYNIDYPTDASYLDLVIGPDSSIYMCSTSFTGTSSSTWNNVMGYFTVANNFKFVATEVLLSKNAKINFLTNNELYLIDSSNNITGGAKGTDSSGEINFWAGSNVPENANFRVLNNGTLYANSGIFAGYTQMKYYPIASLNHVGSRYNGYYIADDRAYLIADNNSGSYGMGDGGYLMLPEPDASLNGFTYHIIVEPNVATKTARQNPGLTIMTSSKENVIKNYVYANTTETYAYASFYGGHIEITCVPYYYNSTYNNFAWCITQCTGGFLGWKTPDFTYEGNWTRNGLILTSNPIRDNEATWEKIKWDGIQSFDLTIQASSEENWDWGYICGVDTPYSTSEYLVRVSGEDSSTVNISTNTYGTHYLYVGYKKDTTGEEYDDNVTVTINPTRTLSGAYSTVCGYSKDSDFYTITKICADPDLPSSKNLDTLYIER